MKNETLLIRTEKNTKMWEDFEGDKLTITSNHDRALPSVVISTNGPEGATRFGVVVVTPNALVEIAQAILGPGYVISKVEEDDESSKTGIGAIPTIGGSSGEHQA